MATIEKPALPSYTRSEWEAVVGLGGYMDDSTPAHWKGAGLFRLTLPNWKPKAKGGWKLMKVPNAHWRTKSNWLQKPPLPSNILNDWMADAHKKGAGYGMGIVPYYKGLMVFDVDQEPTDIYIDQIVDKYGHPLAIVHTPSGGAHIIYPIKGSVDANGEHSIDQAIKDWPAGKFEINGEECGEVPCASRFAALWEPEKWLKAMQVRKAMLEAGDDDTDFTSKFIASSDIEWAAKQPAQGGARVYEDRPTTDATMALFNAFVNHYKLTPAPAKAGEYQGECPVCPVNDGGTRFNATAKNDHVLYTCYVCGCGSEDDRLAILDAVKKRGKYHEAHQAMKKIPYKSIKVGTAGRTIDALLDGFAIGLDQKRDIRDEFMIAYNSKKLIELARKKKSPVKSDTEPHKKEALERAHSLVQNPFTKNVMDRMISSKSKPEVPMIAEIKRIANCIDLPDYTAQHDVDMLLAAGKALGVGHDVLDEARADYAVLRRNGGVIMANGDFPLAIKFVLSNMIVTGKAFYADKESLISDMKSYGGVVVPDDTDPRTSDGVMTAIRGTGVKIIWSELDTALMIQHEDVREWGADTKCDPPEFAPLLQLQKGIVRSVARIKHEKVKVIGRDGKQEKDANGNPVWMDTYVPESFWQSEVAGKAFAIKLLAQVGTEIPRIDYTMEMTKELIKRKDAMTETDRQECVELVQDWLNRIPYIRPVNADRCKDLIRLASMIPYVVFAKRRMQFMTGKARPYSQRTVPVFGGVKRVGKTTLAAHLFPTDGVFEGRISKDFAFSNDENDMKRRVNGRLLVVNDEMAGVATAKPETTKSFITWSDGEYHKKFKNYDKMVRSDVLVATTNKSNEVPADGPLQDRMLFVQLESVEGYSDTERHDGIISWMEEHHERLMIGGLILAEQGVDLNPTDEVDEQRAAAAIALDGSNNQYIKVILDMVHNSICSVDSPVNGPIISLTLVCLHAGLLKYQRDVRVIVEGGGLQGADSVVKHLRGDVISPNDGKGDPDFEWSEAVQMAFRVRANERSTTGAITQVKEAINAIHGSHEGLRRFTEPRAIEKWKKGKSKYLGFAVTEGRMAAMWGQKPIDDGDN